MPRDDKPGAPPGSGISAAWAVAIAAMVLLALLAGLAMLRDRESGDQEPAPPRVASPGPTSVPASPPPTTAPTSAPTPPSPSLSLPASLCPPPMVSAPVTALTLNIHGGLGGGGLNLTQIAQEIRTWDPDIVLLQEVDQGRPRTLRQDQAQTLERRTGLHAVYGGNQPKSGGGTIGNAILSRHPIVASSNNALPQAGGREHRGLLHAVIDIDGLRVSAYSAHWDHGSDVARRAQARATAALVEADPRPTIVGGDLNAVPQSPAYLILRRAGLRDAWRVGEGAGLTVPAHNPRRRIDFLLYGGGFAPLQSTVLDSAVSDHKAVWSRLEVRTQVPCTSVGEPTGDEPKP